MLGAGSNILVSDKGVNAVLVRMVAPHFRNLSVKDNCFIAGAGCLLNRLILEATDKGYSGLEFLTGIPGSVGGALAMNAGAWGREIGDFLDTAIVMDRNGKIRELRKKDISFKYRDSSLARYFILKASFRLTKGSKKDISGCIRGYLLKRKGSQDLSVPSAGCVFKNPPGSSAGKLIEHCGLKGRKIGGASVSLKHANFIINDGNASAKDVLKLIKIVRAEVKNKFNLILQREIKVWQ